MNIKSILISVDIWLALALTVASYYFLYPEWVNNEMAKDLFGVGINVLSIIFSVFFASLAIIMASTDDDFLNFLNEEGDYERIISTFRYTIMLLFFALILSIILFARTTELLSRSVREQSHWFLETFSFFFLYALFASLNVTRDAIRYSEFRSRFVSLIGKGPHAK
jgi:hypothetical protein